MAIKGFHKENIIKSFMWEQELNGKLCLMSCCIVVPFQIGHKLNYFLNSF